MPSEINIPLLIKILNHISSTGKWRVVDRIRAIMSTRDDEPPQNDQEKRIDLIFAYCNDKFPDDDAELLIMYLDWIERELLSND